MIAGDCGRVATCCDRTVALVYARPLRGTRACYRDRRDHRDHRDCAWEVLRTGNRRTGTTRILRVALTVHWQSTQRARRPLSQCLRSSQWPGAQAWLAISRWSRWSRWSRPAHWKMKFLAGGPATGWRHSSRAAQPLDGGIPCGRSSHWMVAIPRGRPSHLMAALLAGGPATGWRQFLAGGPAAGM